MESWFALIAKNWTDKTPMPEFLNLLKLYKVSKDKLKVY